MKKHITPTAPGLPGLGPDTWQIELLPEFKGTGTTAPLIDPETIKAKQEQARLRQLSQQELI